MPIAISRPYLQQQQQQQQRLCVASPKDTPRCSGDSALLAVWVPRGEGAEQRRGSVGAPSVRDGALGRRDAPLPSPALFPAPQCRAAFATLGVTDCVAIAEHVAQCYFEDRCCCAQRTPHGAEAQEVFAGHDDPTPGELAAEDEKSTTRRRAVHRMGVTTRVVHRAVDLFVQWHTDDTVELAAEPFMTLPSAAVALVAAVVAVKLHAVAGPPPYSTILKRAAEADMAALKEVTALVEVGEMGTLMRMEMLMAFHCDCSRPTASELLLAALTAATTTGDNTHIATAATTVRTVDGAAFKAGTDARGSFAAVPSPAVAAAILEGPLLYFLLLSTACKPHLAVACSPEMWATHVLELALRSSSLQH